MLNLKMSKVLLSVKTRKWSRYWTLPLVVQGGSLWTLTQKTHFPKKNVGIYQGYSKTFILLKEKLKNNVRFGK